MPSFNLFLVVLLSVAQNGANTLLQTQQRLETNSKILQQILWTRSPLEPCLHVVEFNDFQNVLSPLIYSSLSLTSAILQRESSRSKSLQEFRYSPACIHLLLSENPQGFHKHWLHTKILNLRPLNVHFIFLGTEASLKTLTSNVFFKALKHKTGLAIDTHAVVHFDPLLHPLPSAVKVQPLLTDHQGIQGQTLLFSLWKVPPWVSFSGGKPTGGLTYVPMEQLSLKFNFSVKYDIAIKPMNQLPNGTWRGFMYDITEGDSEGLFALSPTETRFKAAEFTGASDYFILKFYTSPAPVHIKWEAIVYPFDAHTWALILTVLVIAIPVYYLQLRLSHSRHKDGLSVKTGSLIYKSISIPIAAMLQESFKIPRGAKFLTVLFFAYALIIDTCYNSNLISFLTFPAPDPLPTTFPELAKLRKNFRIKLSHYPGSMQTMLFEETQDKTLLTIREDMEFDMQFWKCIIEAGSHKKTICLEMTVNAPMYRARNLTIHSNWNPLVESKTDCVTSPAALALRRHSRYYEFFNFRIAVFRDMGLFTRWREDAIEKVRRESKPWMQHNVKEGTELARNLTEIMMASDKGTLKPFSLRNFVLCFVSLLICLSVACTSFVVELGYQYLNGV